MQLFVPKALHRKVIELAHDAKMSGHLGIKKTQDRIKTRFHWTTMYSEIRRYCKSCVICLKTIPKGRGGRPVPLGKTPLIDVPFKIIAIDLIGPMKPKSEEGHQYVLTIMAYATRYPEAIPLKGCTAKK